MTHGEGLSGQDAIGHDALEKLILFDSRNQESQGICLRRKLLYHVIAMDVIDLAGILG